MNFENDSQLMHLSVAIKAVAMLLLLATCNCNGVNSHSEALIRVFTSPRGMRFVYVIGGEGVLGDGSKHQPFRKVRLEPYWICEHETRVRDVALMVSEARFFGREPETPASGLDYAEILQIIDKMSKEEQLHYKLPSEDQWEFAARAGKKGETYPWGEGSEKANANIDSNILKPVKQYLPNDFGLYDCIGNVQELVSEPYFDFVPDPEASIADGPAFRLVRGGTMNSWYAPTSTRIAHSVGDAHLWFDTGFRLVLEDSEFLHKQSRLEELMPSKRRRASR